MKLMLFTESPGNISIKFYNYTRQYYPTELYEEWVKQIYLPIILSGSDPCQCFYCLHFCSICAATVVRTGRISHEPLTALCSMTNDLNFVGKQYEFWPFVYKGVQAAEICLYFRWIINSVVNSFVNTRHIITLLNSISTRNTMSLT